MSKIFPNLKPQKRIRNPTCYSCPNGRNSLNGRYCPIFEIYVEYVKPIECNKDF